VDKSTGNYKRNTSTIIQDRDAQLAAEANEWARAEVRKWFDTNKVGFYSAADILANLDERVDAPSAWLRWLSEYATRYQMVRNSLVSLAKREFLETRQGMNALGREATEYQRARGLDDWQVVVQGGEEDSVTDLVTGWLRSNPRALKGCRAISITRRNSSSSEHTQAGPSRTPQGTVSRRRSR